MPRRAYKAVPEAADATAGELATSLGLPGRSTDDARLVIGRREWLALPDLGAFPLNAKTDSGAFGSSLHAEDIKLLPDGGNVSFTTYNHHRHVVRCIAPVARVGRVRNSSGDAEKRIFIQTTAAFCGGLRFQILISLANRADMLCPLLLGRRAIAGYFLIDPLGSHLLGTRRQLEAETRGSSGGQTC